ncbi:MAG: PIG-L family deacetylase [Vicinamibacteria bacterium]|nr:PIG-L family deacetylase [Vicinamibacteria bacterium]
MADELRLACVLAHPDDETLGVGGALARAAAEGIATFVITATRGQAGRYRDNSAHPGPEALGRIREAELRAAAAVLGVREVRLLDYRDGALDQADPQRVIGEIALHLREIRPHVVLTFAPDGAYGHPDHVAISQFATAAVVAAADPRSQPATPAHVVSKLYYMAWSAAKWAAYQAAFKKLVSRVDGVERQASPWPDWLITTVVDTAAHWPTVWRAVQCHESQMMIYGPLATLSDEDHRGLWGVVEFYRAMSLVNGGRAREQDLFEGLR